MGQYLEEGSLSQDYIQPVSSFIKSKQGDVNVGCMFHNFCAHYKERENLGVRLIKTCNDGSWNGMSFPGLRCYALVVAPRYILPTKANLACWKLVWAIGMIF